jgi:hypothetical protein
MSNENTISAQAEALKALGIEQLRTKTREALGGGSWVVKASKAQLIGYILRGSAPTVQEQYDLSKAVVTGPIPPSNNGIVGHVIADRLTAPSSNPQPQLVEAVANAIASALAGAGNATVNPETIVETIVASGKVRDLIGSISKANDSLVRDLVREDLILVETEVGNLRGQISRVEYASNLQAERVIEVESKVAEVIKNQNSNRTLTIVVPEKPVYNAGVAHQEFETLVRLLSLKLNVYLAGPAGSGKTESVHKASDALGLAFYPTSVSQQTSKSDIFGYINPGTGVLVRTPFRNAYENGGVFLLDEIDAGNPNVLVSINSAISNGGASFPDGYVKRHPDFRAVASANTWGYGADRQYVGRNQLDSATLDRFAKVSWDYDEAFELAITPNTKWTKHVQALRHSAFTLKERIVISPRASINGAVAIAGGFDWDKTERLFIFEGVNPEVEAKIRKGVK